MPFGLSTEALSLFLAGRFLPSGLQARSAQFEALSAHAGQGRRMRELPQQRIRRVWRRSYSQETRALRIPSAVRQNAGPARPPNRVSQLTESFA